MADLGCGAKCAKGILLFINLIFALIGVVLLGFGIFLVVEVKAFHNELLKGVGLSDDLIIASAIVILVVGVVIFFVALIGCFGASRENSGCLTCYSVLVGLLVLLQIIAVIMAGVFYSQIIGSLSETMMNMVVYDYGQPEKNETITRDVDYIQYTLQCCGVDKNGPLNWANSYWRNETKQKENVPWSCCIMFSNSSFDTPAVANNSECQRLAYVTNDTMRNQFVNAEGCEAKMDQWIKHYVGILVGVIIAFVIIQIVFVVVACLLKSSVASRYEYV